MKSLHWYTDDIRDTLRSWPDDVKKEIGDQLRQVQAGGFPARAKWLKDLGDGVVQLKEKGYRTVVTVAFGDVIWAVHAFEKDAREGKETRKRHKDLIRKRVADLQTRYAATQRKH